MYVFQFTMNEIRLTESGLGDCLCSYACVFLYCFVLTVHVPNCFEPRPKFQVMYVVLLTS